MEIREATLNDLTPIRRLTVQISAASTQTLSSKQLAEMIGSADQAAIVCGMGRQKLAFLAMGFLPGADIKGNFAVISHFALQSGHWIWETGERLEEHAVNLARSFCSGAIVCKGGPLKNLGAERFCLRQGYRPMTNHFVKEL